MNKNIAWAILIVLVIALGAWLVFGNYLTAEAPAGTAQENATVPTDGTPSESRTVTVTYTDQGFSPSTLGVHVGDTVTFSNQSTRDMWIGSNEHPTHTEYDGTSREEHCAEDASVVSFDQCGRSGPGSTYSFTFTKAGTFEYHNHARSDDGGTIIVE